ncbi:hypothetical protein I4U23_019764 [Adineta vaga]|nr:hypothetical protein I4U23_019764 [Adineta vaga]
MAKFNTIMNKMKQFKSYHISTLLRWTRLRWYILIFISYILLVYIHPFRSLSPTRIPQLWSESHYSKYMNFLFENPAPVTNPPDIFVDMNERKPSFKLAMRSDDRPFLSVDRAQSKLLERLRLYETCQRDSSTIVVDVGAYLGEFGLYAAACGCTVYLFEAQPDMIKLLHSSIKQNIFPTTRVHVYHNVVTNLPSNTNVSFPPGDGSVAMVDNPVTVRTIRLDDVQWPSPSIFMLRIDVDGSEFNVLRSAKKLFTQKRIQHLLFTYTPWLSERSSQKELLPNIKNDFKAKFVYSLFRTDDNIYGPLLPRHLTNFYDQILNLNIPAEVYAVFDDKISQSTIKAKRYHQFKS